MSRIPEISLLGKVPEGARFIGFDPTPASAATLANRARIQLEALLLLVDEPAHRHLRSALEEVETVEAIIKDDGHPA